MSATPNLRTGGQILVDQLRIHGADTIFCVPGESYLATLDALYDAKDDIKVVICRQEGGAANMADAYGKLTGRPGIVFATRGPGAANASLGIHTAHQDSTPVILLLGQVGRAMMDREAFQEVDYHIMFGPLTKGVLQAFTAGEVADITQRALAIAVDGRPGPVVVVLPENVTTSEDGALHAEKYFITSSLDFADTRPAFRWRHLTGLARVTASEYGQPAPGYAQACELLGVKA